MFSVIHGCKNGVRGLAGRSVNVSQTASLMGRTTRGKPLKLRPPFPYTKKRITKFEEWMDSTLGRLSEENAKLIVVDGPIAAGKTAFIKMLAEEFDMYALPEPTMDQIYITKYGYDMRNLDDYAPEGFRTYDHKNFSLTPRHKNVSKYQINMTLLRYAQYIEALAHILNTGQGVIMERSIFSQVAFVEAMHAEGYLPKAVRDHYFFMIELIDAILLRPHVVIYLDVPVSIVQERIKARGLSYEVNSNAFTPSFLSNLDKYWKNKYLPSTTKDSEVLVFDWSQGGDVDLVIEELESLDLNPLNRPEFGKLFDWRTFRADWRIKRMQFTNDKAHMYTMLARFANNVPELCDSMEDREKYRELFRSNEYETGFNPQLDGAFNVFLGLKKESPSKLYFEP